MRLAVLDPTPERRALALKVLERGKAWRGNHDVWFAPRGLAADGGKLAFLFPGVEAAFAPAIDDVAAALAVSNDAIAAAVATGAATPRELELRGVGVFALGRLLGGALARLGVAPDAIAGHSLGEWTGMVASEMIPPADVDAFVGALPAGSLEVPDVVFAAVGCGATGAAAALDGLDAITVSHDNCPHQSILCGKRDRVRVAIERLASRGVLCQELPFRSGFHSPLFADYLDLHRRHLAQLALQRPRIPLWSATRCAPYPDDPAAIRALAVEHLVAPVRFRELIEALYAAGIRTFVQLGVGSLTGFVDDTLRGRDHLAVSAAANRIPTRTDDAPRPPAGGPRSAVFSTSPGLAQLARVSAALFVDGYDVSLARPRESETTSATTATSAAAPSATATSTTTSSTLPMHSATTPSTSPMHSTTSAVLSTTTSSRSATSTSGSGSVSGSASASASSGPGSGRAPMALELGVPLVRLAGIVPPLTLAAAARPADVGDPVVAEMLATLDEAASATRSVLEAYRARTRPRAATTKRRLSVEQVPALLDHCFYRQPPGWPAVADRYPVVPMTMNIAMMIDAARPLAPDRVAIAVEDIRAYRWLAVAPAVEIELAAKLRDDGAVDVDIPGYARATVRFANSYPAAPPARLGSLAAPRATPVTAREMYDERWMFHGPGYQGVVEMGPMGDDGVDGVIETLPAPGALLDCAGQLMGWWVMQTERVDRLAMPVKIDRIALFGADPTPGERVGCRVRMRAVREREVRADLELTANGRIWAAIEGWEDRRFDSDDPVWAVLMYPEHHALAEPQPGGYVTVTEHWRGAASRELMMRRYLGERERAAHDALGPRAKRSWLLGRIAIKDAARLHAWATTSPAGHPIWPVEVEVANEPSGAPVIAIASRARRGEPALHVSVAHKDDLAVAIVDDTRAVGIDVERIAPRTDTFGAIAFAPGELVLGAGRDPAEWATRLWTAKEAVAKLRRTGMTDPKQVVVRAVTGDRLYIDDHAVDTQRHGEYIVAWTRGPA